MEVKRKAVMITNTSKSNFTIKTQKHRKTIEIKQRVCNLYSKKVTKNLTKVYT